MTKPNARGNGRVVPQPSPQPVLEDLSATVALSPEALAALLDEVRHAPAHSSAPEPPPAESQTAPEE